MSNDNVKGWGKPTEEEIQADLDLLLETMQEMKLPEPTAEQLEAMRSAVIAGITIRKISPVLNDIAMLNECQRLAMLMKQETVAEKPNKSPYSPFPPYRKIR